MRKKVERAINTRYAEIDDLLARSEFSRAVGAAAELRELVRHRLGEFVPEHASSLNLLGYTYYAAGNLREAARHYRGAIDISRRLHHDNDLDFAIVLSNLAVVLKTANQLDEAEALYREAQGIVVRTAGESDPFYLTCLNNLAELYRAQGKYPEAELLYRQALRAGISSPDLGLGHPTLAAMMGNLGLTYQAEGRLADAQLCLMQAAGDYHDYYSDESGEALHPDYARSLNNLGFLFHELGNLSDAEAYYAEAFRIRREVLGKAHLDTAQSANNLGSLYLEQGDGARSEDFLIEALDVRAEILGSRHPLVAEGMNNLGTLYMSAEDHAKAEPLLSEALHIYRESLGNNHPDLVGSLVNVAATHTATGRFESAQALLREALDVARRSSTRHRLLSVTLSLLGRVLLAVGRSDEGLALMLEGVSADDDAIADYSAIGSERQRAAFMEGAQFRIDGLISLVATSLVTSSAAAGIALDVILRHKLLGLQLEVELRRAASVRGEIASFFQRDLYGLRRDAAHTSFAGPLTGETAEEFARRLREERGVRELQETALSVELGGVPVGDLLSTVNRQAVAAALPAGAALVEFVRGGRLDLRGGEDPFEAGRPARYLAFVVRSEAPDDVRLIDLGEADGLDLQIAALRAAITGDDGEAGAATMASPQVDETVREVTNEADRGDLAHKIFEAARDLGPAKAARQPSDRIGGKLRASLFDPLVAHLEGATRVFLAPDGDLCCLPFEVLPLGDGRRILDAYELSYLTVGRDLLSPAPSPGLEATDSVVVGDPDFDAGNPTESSGWPFRQLEGTRLEADLIASRLGVAPRTGLAALKADVASLSSPLVLHLATHGAFLPDGRQTALEASRSPGPPGAATDWLGRLHGHEFTNPLLRSFLALAGANTWLNGGTPPEGALNGLLTAEEVALMDLAATELVVLSACQTGLGVVHVGEGLLGLRRAFVLAGAQTLIMSLWQVPDRPTQELMDEFYVRLLSGERKDVALRGAQQSVRKRYPDPYFWAAFICQGETGPMSTVPR